MQGMALFCLATGRLTLRFRIIGPWEETAYDYGDDFAQSSCILGCLIEITFQQQ